MTCLIAPYTSELMWARLYLAFVDRTAGLIKAVRLVGQAMIDAADEAEKK